MNKYKRIKKILSYKIAIHKNIEMVKQAKKIHFLF